MIQIWCILVFFLLILSSCESKFHSSKDTLKLVQVIFRHGDTSPLEFGANDPYQNESYWPQGLYHLTSRGKYRIHYLGSSLRKRYNKFFGDSYSPREILAKSVSGDRRIESAAVLLAGAFPPKNPDWNWYSFTHFFLIIFQ